MFEFFAIALFQIASFGSFFGTPTKAVVPAGYEAGPGTWSTNSATGDDTTGFTGTGGWGHD